MSDKINIAITRELHMELKLISVRKSTTLEKLIEDLLRNAIGGNDELGN